MSETWPNALVDIDMRLKKLEQDRLSRVQKHGEAIAAKDFTSANLDPNKIVAKTVTPDDVVNALNALAAIKELHRKGQAVSRRYVIYDSCEYCDDAYGDQVRWPCDTARAWGEK